MDQQTALAVMKTGASVFLTGQPGSGKTHTVNQYVKYLRAHKLDPAITASTGIAATHIGGRTIHSWSGIGIRSELTPKELRAIAKKGSYAAKRIEGARTLVIDEISMLNGRTLSAIDAVCRAVKDSDKPFGGMQVILVGDFFQLPPVTRADEQLLFAFDSEAWDLLAPPVLYLTEQHRQDDDAFLSILSAIRSNDFQQEHFSHLEPRLTARQDCPDGITKLFTHNVNVDAVNERELESLPGEEHSFQMSKTGPEQLVGALQKGCLSPEELVLKVDAAVMFTKNNFAEGYVNGTLGKVIAFDKESGYPVVRTHTGKRIVTEPMDWIIEEDDEVQAEITQIPLRLAWAITVHKSQGMSLDAAIMDLKNVFEFGQGYVALSRVRNLAGLHLLGLNHKAFQVHPDILVKDEEFLDQSLKVEKDHAGIPAETLKERAEQFIRDCGGTFPKNRKAQRGKINN
ncbi:MAG: PIF1 family DEAD/DEAH box helicase [Actinobacteria bacterium]|nr:PIF1 family DEAD/DEAH box helicase [Actinomycetota bacterium]